MSETCENKALLQRDGTSQQQRLMKALLPEYVAVDERSMKDLIGFVQKLAGEINYFGSDNKADGDWKNFFESDKDLDIILNSDDAEKSYLDFVKEKSGFTQPHFAMFLAFLKLFKIAQDDLNQITKKHLDFYYKDVLQLKEKPAEPDQVFIIFKLAKHISESHLVEEDTALKAGKDDTGQKLYYETDSDLVVNHGEVSEIKAVFADVSNDYRLYASPVANSADGEGADIETEEKSWETFGSIDREQADIGFSIASPILFLAEGKRTISIKLQFDNKTKISKIPFADHAFDVLFSGEEEWIIPEGEDDVVTKSGQIHPQVAEKILAFVNSSQVDEIAAQVKDDPNKGYGDQIDDYGIGSLVAGRIVTKRGELGSFTDVEQLRDVIGLGQDKIDDLAYTFRNLSNAILVDPGKNTLTIIRTLEESQPAVVAYNEEVLGDPIKTQWPVAKILLNIDYPGNPYIYKLLKDLKVISAEVNVNVSDVKTNIIQNDAAMLDPGKPFQPFGNRPVLGSSFYIGNREIFQKNLDDLQVNILWHDLPAGSMGTHYANYTASTASRENTSFKAEISILDDREWEQINSDYQLFANTLNNEPVLSENNIYISVANTGAQHSVGDIGRDEETEEFTEYDQSTQRGFLRLTLKGVDFGHKDYTPSFTKQILKGVRENTDPALPNEPYTPTIKEFSLDYSSTVKIDLTGQAEEEFDDRVDQYFYVYPFGITELETTEKSNSFFPVFSSEGNLYIGISKFTGGRILSLLFQVAEGSADPDFLQQDVHWSYLSKNKWVVFDQQDILSDSTNQLLTSGIIQFDISKKASTAHTILTGDMVWLKATVDEKTPAVSDIIDIQAQAVTATFEDNNNDPDHLATSLEAGTIKKLKESDSAIDSLSQPFASFGGKLKEESGAFYTRVSERLRHKQRAISIWDYERLILAEFPSVYKVKCLNHTIFNGSLTDYSEIAPGHVSVIVISNVARKNAVNPLKPKTSLITLTEIEEFLEKIKAEAVQLHIRNPLYEEIKVDFNVRFREGIDAGFYQNILIEDIKAFLSPWAFEDSSDVVFGGKIHKSMILNFVEEREYVDFVTCFKMYHIVPTDAGLSMNKDIDEAEASTTASVLGSAETHTIHVLETDDCECDDNLVSAFKELSKDECGC